MTEKEKIGIFLFLFLLVVTVSFLSYSIAGLFFKANRLARPRSTRSTMSKLSPPIDCGTSFTTDDQFARF